MYMERRKSRYVCHLIRKQSTICLEQRSQKKICSDTSRRLIWNMTKRREKWSLRLSVMTCSAWLTLQKKLQDSMDMIIFRQHFREERQQQVNYHSSWEWKRLRVISRSSVDSAREWLIHLKARRYLINYCCRRIHRFAKQLTLWIRWEKITA